MAADTGVTVGVIFARCLSAGLAGSGSDPACQPPDHRGCSRGNLVTFASSTMLAWTPYRLLPPASIRAAMRADGTVIEVHDLHVWAR